MRKLLFLLLAALLLTGTALADEIPAQVQAMLEDYHGARYATDYLEFTLPDGRRAGIAVTEGSSLEGFICKDGQWTYTLMASVMDELRPAHLERAAYDPLTYHLTNADNTARLTYRCEGEEFRLTGWVLPGSEPVTVDGDVFTYGTGDTAVEIVIPGGLWSDHPFSADDLPLTLEKAMARAAISEQNAAEMFPGYTLRGYTSYNDGDMADAVYSRIEGGILHIRRAFLEAGMEPDVLDALPVPLSGALLRRLETEAFDDLISCWHDHAFRTQDAFDREALSLPANAVIRDNVVQEQSIIALCEVDGARYLYVWEAAPTGYALRVTQPLPANAYLDTYHAPDGSVQIEWDEQNMSAAFARREDGSWQLSWCTSYGPSADIHFSANAFGITYFDEDGAERMRVGALTAGDLFTVDFADLDGAAPTLDQSGWAVVNNPDPADRLHLRTEPDKSSHSRGKFYNGTPVKVLRKSGSWTKVQIGFGPTARTGWMMTKYLAFGADMDKVQPVFPDLFYREEYERENKLDSGFWVAGVDEDGSPKQYILLGWDGTVVYIPQAWLFGGYG